ncbi:hypothetical protein CVT24_010652 [Panaeolus cyanescens]|uniref:non-specific serine/threonine protein kinase n=1 Tax=Panaeolus cyanescens TaxID=181874 RepID=A0A409YLX2_9AGAR|nr:hypothetical protein CVT24_010652 [Panaeolus cyanescens]
MSTAWLFAIHVTHAHQEFLYLAAFETTSKGILLIGSIQLHRVFPKARNNRLEWTPFPHVRDAWFSASSTLPSFSLTNIIPFVVHGSPSSSFRPPLHLLDYSASYDDSFYSLFYFLRHRYRKCIGSTRRVLLEQDGFHITQIGRGSFAVISRVLYRPTGETRVMKRISFDKAGLAEYLAQNEIDALKAMKGNKWFPPLLNHFMDGSEFVVTMPYYRRGDLASLIEHRQFLGTELAKFYCAELILAIHALHKVGIVHRDIKPDNIFLDDNGHLLLADLGLAENIAIYEGGDAAMVSFPEWLAARDQGGDGFPFLWAENRNPLSIVGVAGTFWYTAPEVFRKERYSFGVDYWSVGVIYHELITGHMPFDYFRPYPDDKRPQLDFSPKFGQIRSASLTEEQALRHLLSPEPEDRPQTLQEIKDSVLFRGM